MIRKKAERSECGTVRETFVLLLLNIVYCLSQTLYRFISSEVVEFSAIEFYC
jgi:hypothetical protein